MLQRRLVVAYASGAYTTTFFQNDYRQVGQYSLSNHNCYAFHLPCQKQTGQSPAVARDFRATPLPFRLLISGIVVGLVFTLSLTSRATTLPFRLLLTSSVIVELVFTLCLTSWATALPFRLLLASSVIVGLVFPLHLTPSATTPAFRLLLISRFNGRLTSLIPRSDQSQKHSDQNFP